MLSIVLIRPGSTDLDEQGRIKGSLDIPLNENGLHQVDRTVGELANLDIDCIYTSCCCSAQQTAEKLADRRSAKIKRLDGLRNLDHGLWHGKLIEEVKKMQPKVYRQMQEHPETVCPPEGESLQSAQQRVRTTLVKLLKKHKRGVVALVVPEPLASVVRSVLNDSQLGDLWKAECDCGNWELIEIKTEKETCSN